MSRLADARVYSGVGEAHIHTGRNQNGEWDIANSTLGHHVMSVLKKNFPGHPWYVEPEVEQGVVRIAVDGFRQWMHVIYVTSLKGDPRLMSVVRAGGELLERLNMPRTGFSVADWQTALRTHPSHFNRHSKPPEG